MKKKLAALIAGALCVSALAACGTPGNDAPAAGDGEADKTITVGANPTPHAEILNAAKDVLAEAGYTLNVMEFSDYVLPNTALDDGELDANYFQHAPYLETFNTEHDTKLAVAAEMHYEPFGLYPGKVKTLGELADGATIAIPNDGSNETRALLLLQDAGLIKVKEGTDPTTLATVLDITENPHNYQIRELAAEQLTLSLEDVDMAVINGNYALQVGLNANDNALITEKAEYGTVYVNVVACREGDEGSDKIKALVDALRSDTVKKFIEDTYRGAVVPTF